MTVDILCRVVDNLGDIGFVYRLARALSELPNAPELRLVVDDLAAFASICPGINPSVGYQRAGSWEVVRWNNPGSAAETVYREKKPTISLECYACGRPDWFERLLFDPSNDARRFLVNLEYLTAEEWSVDYHLLPSLTRSPSVHKAVFMPGFRPGTGGLLQDAAFLSAIDTRSSEAGKHALRRGLLGLAPYPDASLFPEILPLPRQSPIPSTTPLPGDLVRSFWFVLFSYEHDFSTLIGDLSSLSPASDGRHIVVFLASGRSADPFLCEWNRAGCPFPVVALPMLPQQTWDRLLVSSDFSIVRGEESLSRAALAGNPFLWDCYPFTDKEGDLSGHYPKIKALHGLLRDAFAEAGDTTEDETGNESGYKSWERLSLGFNGIESPVAGDLRAILDNLGEFAPAFRYFARKTRDLGNLAVNLMTFLRVSG